MYVIALLYVKHYFTVSFRIVHIYSYQCICSMCVSRSHFINAVLHFCVCVLEGLLVCVIYVCLKHTAEQIIVHQGCNDSFHDFVCIYMCASMWDVDRSYF